MGGFEGIVSGSLLVFLSLFLTSIIFGRAFCSWFCPAGALGGCARKIQDKPTKPRANIIKYGIWVPWVLTILFGFFTAGGIRQIDPFYMTDYGVSITSIYGYFIYLPVVALILIPSLIFGRHTFCHSLCWISPWMVLGSKIKEKLNFPSYRLTADTKNCISCRKCSKVCPMSIDVMALVQNEAGMYHNECILCGECVEACPKNALKLSFSKKKCN
jgi:polyferredoxin